MAARAAIALCLTALAWAGTVRAQDNPACAQYREPMAYNACLAQHGPKANGVGQLHGGPQRGAQSDHAAPNRVSYGKSRTAPNRLSYEASGEAPSTRFYDTQGSQRIHGRAHMEFQVH
jgi:hypothetical protein